MKIKHTKKTTTGEKDLLEILKWEKAPTGEIDLLDILKWKNDYRRENITYENDSIQIKITFWAGFKGVIITFIKSNLKLSFDTNRISPEKIIEAIESIMKTLGVEYEN